MYIFLNKISVCILRTGRVKLIVFLPVPFTYANNYYYSTVVKNVAFQDKDGVDWFVE